MSNIKPNQLIVLVLITGLSINLLSCKDKDPDPQPNPPPPIVKEEQLPPITTKGAGTFGCKVNGKVWVAKSNKMGWPPTYTSIDKNNQYLTNISGSIIIGNNVFLVLSVLFKTNEKTQYLIGYNNDNDPKGQFVDAVANKQWLTDSLLGGGVTLLRYDSLNQVLSGTFYFDCVNKETNDTLHITDGRFDMNYTY